MHSIEDSARPHGMADEEVLLGIVDESKAPNAKGPTVGPSTSKRKRSEPNENEQEEDAPKKKKGGRQPFTNSFEYISHDKYNTVPGESKHDRDKRLQWIRRHRVRKWFSYEFVHPRFSQNFAFHPPWGDCREIALIKPNDPQERPPPPPNAHESSLHTPESYPDELAKRQRNAIKRAKREEKKKAHEEENRRLLQEYVMKKKAEGKSEGCSKRKHDPSTAASKRKSAPKKRKDELADKSLDEDDPPLTKDEVAATLSEQVNITTSMVLPDLRVAIVPKEPPKKISLRKTPPTIVTMVDRVNTTPHPKAINMKDLVIDAPVSTANPGEPIPKT